MSPTRSGPSSGAPRVAPRCPWCSGDSSRREVERDRARRIREGTVDDQVLLDALERARELHEDVAVIIERLERRAAPPVPPAGDEPGQQAMDLPDW